MPVSPSLRPKSLRAYIAQKKTITRPYLEDARSDRIVTYATLASASDAWRQLFETLKLPQGATVVLDIADPLAFSVAQLSVVAAGLRSIPIDPNAPWSDVLRISELVNGAQLVVSARDGRQAITGTTVLSISLNTFLPVDVPKTVAIRPLIASDAPNGSVILFTSGSTGNPKGVELPEAQLLFVGEHIARHNALTSADRGYNSLPLFHVNAQVVGLIATLVAGATLVLDARFHRTAFWELLRQRRITWMNGAPAILAILARTGEIDTPETLRFIRSASAPLPDIIRDAFKSVTLLVSYGMTEGASQITATPLDEPFREGSVGVPVGNELQIRDLDGSILPVGEIGQVWIRGEGVITHYLYDAAAERFDTDGWLQTGDLGCVDDDGYVYLKGRADDLINRGGENLYPAEIENVLLEDAMVQEAVVAARADEVLGQVPVAYVIPVDKSMDAAAKRALIDALTERCVAALSKFKRPAEILVVEDLPRAATGKFQRVKIREKAASDAL